MNRRIGLGTRGWLAWSLLCICCFLGWEARASESPAPLPRLQGAATNVLTLEGAIRLALDGNAELRASRIRIEAATGRAYQAKLWSNPELTLNAEDWPVNRGGGYSDSKQTIGVAQTIPFPGKKTLGGDTKSSLFYILIRDCGALEATKSMTRPAHLNSTVPRSRSVWKGRKTSRKAS